ncbi:Retinoic acid induced 16-like protein-domain-containing protein [Dichotomocladium elegans]|nr:Retinoic acid induced 16-like protein-domain-containing protein [Dichotomocladium elegans]
MSMFLSKFLAGRSNAKSNLELLTEAWTSIQKYYETSPDPLKDAVDSTPIPLCLRNIVQLIQSEELGYQRASDSLDVEPSLETGPCLEYLLHKRVLEELVEFAKVDTPFGMRVHCLRFFCNLVNNVHAKLLPERAVHVPLQKLISSCHRLIAHHYEQLATDPQTCPEERHQAISELSLELVKLMHGIFSHFKGANAALMDLFFERGWCRDLGENVWRSSKDGRTSHKRRESVDEKIAWNMFLTPRFDMFTYLIDYMNMPGETGEIAREAILFALRLLDGDPEYVCYVVEYSGLCDVMVRKHRNFAERLALFFAKLPKNAGAFTISDNGRVIPVRPPRRRIQFSVPAMITSNSLMITVNAHHSFKKKRRKRSPFDVNFVRTLQAVREGERTVDEFYSFWEYLNDVARVAERRLMTALMAQLTAIFWHPVVCTALSSPSAELATAATAYTTEMIRSLTDQKLLHAFLVVLIGEEGGVGKDLEPEVRTTLPRSDLIEEDQDDDSMQNEEDEDEKDKIASGDETDVDLTLRLLLINRINAEYHDLSLSTLRMFDTILETYNQFAIYNLVLRNYLDITPEGDYIEEIEKLEGAKESRDTLELPGTTDLSCNESKKANETIEKAEKVGELAVGEDQLTDSAKKDSKTDKVRWLVERILSLLPLEDELERMKSPPLSSVISSDSFASSVHGTNTSGTRRSTSESRKGTLGEGPLQNVVIPGNSYDDYFHEARERFQYGLLARNFWRVPYPPAKTKKDYIREAEHRRGRPQRRPMSMIVSSKDAALHRGFENEIPAYKRCGGYEGLFMSRIFDQFFKLLESTMEQNLLVTSILQKIVGVVDKRVDGVICDWRAVRVGGDGSLYGGVWTLPSAKGNRRSLYSLLEQITFEALKRAQLVPNFETRISIAKKRGVHHATATSNSHHHQHHQPKRSMSAFTRTPPSHRGEQQGKSLSRHPSLSQLVFSKTSSSKDSPPSPLSPGSPVGGNKSNNLLSLRTNREALEAGAATNVLATNSADTPSSPSASFFQQSQRANATPITMTNPFAKLSNFVNSYIVLQEFCKELAAVILVRHATNYNESGLDKYQEAHPSLILPYDWVDEHSGPFQQDDEDGNDSGLDVDKPYMDKWKNRISMVSSLADWRSVRSLDIIDEAITARVRSASSDGKW